MLGKTRWRILSIPDSVVSTVLKAKYSVGRSKGKDPNKILSRVGSWPSPWTDRFLSSHPLQLSTEFDFLSVAETLSRRPIAANLYRSALLSQKWVLVEGNEEVCCGQEMEQTAKPLNMQMGEAYIENAKYIYLHDQKWPTEAIDVHHVVVRRSTAKGILVCLSVILSWASALYLYPAKGQSVLLMCWSFLFGVFLIKLLLLEPIKKESVMVMPSFGVQLETHHVSGRVTRRFIPIDKILKPVLVECVTPVTCFWSLSLIVRGEEKLMLVFKELRPPSKMLVPIWKALCAATDSPKIPDPC